MNKPRILIQAKTSEAEPATKLLHIEYLHFVTINMKEKSVGNRRFRLQVSVFQFIYEFVMGCWV
jgi:hypothetical protein